MPAKVTDRLDVARDAHDVYSLSLGVDDAVVVRASAATGDFDLRLYGPGATGLSDAGAIVGGSTSTGPNEEFRYTPPRAGTYYVDVAAAGGGGA